MFGQNTTRNQYSHQQHNLPVQGIPISVQVHPISNAKYNNCYKWFCTILGLTGIIVSIIIITSVIIEIVTTDCSDQENSDSNICK